MVIRRHTVTSTESIQVLAREQPSVVTAHWIAKEVCDYKNNSVIGAPGISANPLAGDTGLIRLRRARKFS